MSPRPSRDARYFKLLGRCLRWGIITGAVTGTVIGALIALAAVIAGSRSELLAALTAATVVYGALVGVLVAAIPSLLGAVVVTGLLPRHPQQSSEDDVQRDLRAIFRSMVALLDATVLAGVIASRASLPSVANAVPLILAGNISVILMLRRARRSIGRIVVAAG